MLGDGGGAPRIVAALMAILVGCGTAPIRRMLPGGADAPRPEPSLAIVPATVGTPVSRTALLSNGRVLAWGWHHAYVLDPTDLAVRAALEAPEGSRFGLLQVGDRIVYEGGVWDAVHDRAIPLPRFGDVDGQAASPSGRWVARLHDYEQVVLVDVAEATARELDRHEHTERLVFVADDRLLAWGRHGSVLLDVPSGERIAELGEGWLTTHPHAPVFVLARDGADVVDVRTGQVLHHLESPDEGRVLSVDEDQRFEGVVSVSTRRRGSTLPRRHWFDIASGEEVERPDPPEAPDELLTVEDDCSLALYLPDEDDTRYLAEASALDGDDEDVADGCDEPVVTEGGVAVYALGVVMAFDLSTGERLATSAPGELVGTCGDEPIDDFVYGLRIPERWGRFGGCAQRPPTIGTSYVDRDIESSGEVGHSRNGRYRIVAHRSDEDDEDDWSAGLAIVDLEDDQTVRSFDDLRVHCEYMRDQTPEGGWYSYTDCQGQALVSDDGARLYFRDPEAGVVVVDLGSGERRVIDVGRQGGGFTTVGRDAVVYANDEGPGWLIASGEALRSETPPAVHAQSAQVALATPEAIRVVDARTLEARDVPRDASEETWRFTSDGALLVREEPATPLVRIDVAAGALLETATLPDGFELDPSRLTDDGRALVQCVDDAVRAVSLDDGSVRALADAPGCAARVHHGPRGAVAIIDGATGVLVRGDDRLDLERMQLGQRVVWIVRAAERFWVPEDLLGELRARRGGDPVTARLAPIEEDPGYDRELLERFFR